MSDSDDDDQPSGGMAGGGSALAATGGNGWSGNARDGSRRAWSGNLNKFNKGELSNTADQVRRDWNNEWNKDWDGDGDHRQHGDGHRHDDHRGDHHNDIPFHANWWKNHGHSWHGHDWNDWDHHHWHNDSFFWWHWATVPRLTTWCAFGWPRQYYWDYGPGEYIYCYNNVIYVNGRWFAPARQYYDQTVYLVDSAPQVTPELEADVEWLPLGVFAMTRAGEKESNLLLQLAVTKDGVVGGTIHDQTTGETFNVEGTVDKTTQRAAWSYVDASKARVVVETSIYNLTKPQCTALVHFGPEQMEVWQLVRLEEPKVEGEAPAAVVPPQAAELPALPEPQAN